MGVVLAKKKMKASSTLFITGGTGFIGRLLVKKLLEKKNQTIYLLVRPGSQRKADAFIKNLSFKKKVKIVSGDLRKKSLGLTPNALEKIIKKATHIFHLGAKFDVSAPKTQAYQNNLAGTDNLIQLALKMKKLKLFAHMSTAYVCGTRTGKIYEDKLPVPPGFRNFYEESKFKAERLVRKNLDKLPTIIFRPSQVVGDSKTGKTDKFDGPYKLIKLIDQEKLFVLPGSCQVPLNIVPVDFVVNAIAAIVGQEKNIGKTFHLCDPHPLTTAQFINLTCQVLGVKKPFFRVPYSFLKTSLSLPLVSSYVKIKRESLDFLNQGRFFDVQNTFQALKSKKIKIPNIRSYLPKIVRFYKKKNA